MSGHTCPECEEYFPSSSCALGGSIGHDCQPRANRAREHVGWLIWCMTEGYVKAEDRAILDNWLLDDDADLSEDDQALKADLLAMADEVLAAVPDA